MYIYYFHFGAVHYQFWGNQAFFNEIKKKKKFLLCNTELYFLDNCLIL